MDITYIAAFINGFTENRIGPEESRRLAEALAEFLRDDRIFETYSKDLEELADCD